MEYCFREFKSEYKKNFQPFNRYDYDENKGIFEKRPITVTDSTDCYDGKSQSSSWYKEVVHLRQQANQYRVTIVLEKKIKNNKSN